jgi:hypothetical protein
MIAKGLVGKEGINTWSTGDFWESETLSYDTVVVDTYYTFVKTHRNTELSESQSRL